MAQYTKFPVLLILCVSLSLWACDKEPSQGEPVENPPIETPTDPPTDEPSGVTVGAVRLLADSLHLVQGKQIAVVANQTSLVAEEHLIDTLLASGVEIVRAFAPEHGFRGTADAGQRVSDLRDPKTGLSIISLYGDNKKPQAQYLQDVDLVVFDIQDVGARFYTYLSTLSYVMEACAEQGVPLLVLDRPNPNGWYVDGPVLESPNSSFIGLHEIPIVHGMTLGEYAKMVNGEGWLANGVQTDLQVLGCTGYTHDMRWADTDLDWVAPSPNLATPQAAYLYPALCWFEPTPMSIGRGTDSAFLIAGAPWYTPAVSSDGNWVVNGLIGNPLSFTPKSLPGKATHPKYRDQACQGLIFSNEVGGKDLFIAGLTLLREAYVQFDAYSGGEPFFYRGFQRWPGNTTLRQQIEGGETPESIWSSWQTELAAFRDVRSRYLLYPEETP